MQYFVIIGGIRQQPLQLRRRSILLLRNNSRQHSTRYYYCSHYRWYQKDSINYNNNYYSNSSNQNNLQQQQKQQQFLSRIIVSYYKNFDNYYNYYYDHHHHHQYLKHHNHHQQKKHLLHYNNNNNNNSFFKQRNNVTIISSVNTQQQQQQHLNYYCFYYSTIPYCSSNNNNDDNNENCSDDNNNNNIIIIDNNNNNSNNNNNNNHDNHYYFDSDYNNNNNNKDYNYISPSKRFESSHTENEWYMLIEQLLNIKQLTSVNDILDVEECIRWITVHVKKQQQHKQNKQHKQESLICVAFDLYKHIAKLITEQEDILLNNNNELKHWYNGEYPRSIHLLNALLDTWRIQIKRFSSSSSSKKKTTTTSDDKSVTVLPSPQQMFNYLNSIHNELNVPVNARSYSIIMDTAIYIMDPYDAPIFCENVLNHILDIADNVVFTITLHAWSKSTRIDASQRAERLFQEYIHLYNTNTTNHRNNNTNNVMPNTVTFNTLLTAMVKTSSKSNKNKKKQQYKSQLIIIQEQLQRIQRAEIIFNEMVTAPYPDVIPNNVSYRIMISAWTELAKQCYNNNNNNMKLSNMAINRAIELLHEIIKINDQQQQQQKSLSSSSLSNDNNNNNRSMEQNQLVDSSYFSIPMSALVRMSGNDNLIKAQLLYDELQQLYERTDNDKRFSPDDNIHILRAMLILYTKTKQPDKAHKILNDLEEQMKYNESNTDKDNSKRINDDIGPTPGHYRDVLNAWIDRFNDLYQSQQQIGKAIIAAEHAQDIIFRMINRAIIANNNKYMPTTIDIGRVFNIWKNCNKPIQSILLFEQIKQYYQQTQCNVLKPIASMYRRVLESLSSTAKTNDILDDAAQKAEHYLNELEKLYNEANPNDKESMQPTVMHYTAVLLANYGNINTNNIQKCKEIFNRSVQMYHNTGNDNVRPDVTLYSALLKCYAKVGDINGAEQILMEMLHDYNNNNNRFAKPHTGIFNLVLLSYLRNNNNDNNQNHHNIQHRRAMEFYHAMKKQQCRTKSGIKALFQPDKQTYNLLKDIFQQSNLIYDCSDQHVIEFYKYVQEKLNGMNKRNPKTKKKNAILLINK